MARSSNPSNAATSAAAIRGIPIAAALLIAVAALGPAQRADPVGLASLQREFVQLVEKLTPAVVRVGKRYTGVVIDGRGYVLSDVAAVPEQTDTAQYVRVELSSGRVYDARPVWRSPRSRTALLKIVKGARFACIPAGDSDTLRVGEFVLTIGNAFNQASQGGQPAVTLGHVAGLWTAGANEQIKIGRIVTTAAINPGTSGGPLIDIRGSLIGINDQQRGPGDMGQVMPINFIRESYAKCDEAYRVLSLGAHKRPSPKRFAGYMDQAITDLARQAAPIVVALRITRDNVQPPEKKEEKGKKKKKGKDQGEPAPQKKGEGDGPKGGGEREEQEKPGENKPDVDKPGEKPPGKKPPPEAAAAPPKPRQPEQPPRPPRKERKDTVMPVDRGPPGGRRPSPRPRGKKRPVFRLKRREEPVSGVIVAADGLILTATANLWEDARKKISRIDVTLADGRTVSAKRLGTDHVRGITAIRVEAKGLPVRPELGQNEAQVGSFVVVIGNPYGDRRVNHEPFLTWGVLSACNQINPAVAALQTDAWVNQANQGGALIDTQGRLLGIAMLYNPARYGLNSGIGFVLPLWSARRSLARLQKGEDVWPGYLGVRLPPVFEPEVRGARIVKTVKYSPADRGGLQPGDCILQINGVRTPDHITALNELGGAIDGERVEVEVTRNGRILNISLTAERRG